MFPYSYCQTLTPEFAGELFSKLMKSMDIDNLRSFAYKPLTNGIVKRFHGTLNSVLGRVVSESQREWDRNLHSERTPLKRHEETEKMK